MANSNKALGSTVYIFSLVQVALAVAVSAITQIHLRQVTFHPIGQTGFGFVTGSCLLGSDYRLNNPCYYAWVVAAVSLFASFAVSMAQCMNCGCGIWLDIVFAICAAVWWCIAGVAFTIMTKQANEAGLPSANWRGTIVGLAWAQVALFVALVVMNIMLYLRKPAVAMAPPYDFQTATYPYSQGQYPAQGPPGYPPPGPYGYQMGSQPVYGTPVVPPPGQFAAPPPRPSGNAPNDEFTQKLLKAGAMKTLLSIVSVGWPFVWRSVFAKRRVPRKH